MASWFRFVIRTRSRNACGSYWRIADCSAALRKPNFFIIGAPKCGTSSMASYLREHPQVFFPEHKEPHFFNTGTGFRSVRSESHYYALFRYAGPQHIAVGEGTALYLYSDVA